MAIFIVAQYNSSEYNSSINYGGDYLTVSKAQQKAQNKWISKTYDRINLTVAKGKKEIIQAHAEARSESVNGFINRAIDEAIERDESAPAASEGHL